MLFKASVTAISLLKLLKEVDKLWLVFIVLEVISLPCSYLNCKIPVASCALPSA